MSGEVPRLGQAAAGGKLQLHHALKTQYQRMRCLLHDKSGEPAVTTRMALSVRASPDCGLSEM
jgi:hypothetical protein